MSCEYTQWWWYEVAQSVLQVGAELLEVIISQHRWLVGTRSQPSGEACHLWPPWIIHRLHAGPLRVCQGRQGNRSLFLPTQITTYPHDSKCRTEIHTVKFKRGKKESTWLLMKPKPSSAPHDPNAMRWLQQGAAAHLAPSAYTHTHTNTQWLYACHVHPLSGPIRMKCHKNVMEKCQSLIIHTDQNSGL